MNGSRGLPKLAAVAAAAALFVVFATTGEPATPGASGKDVAGAQPAPAGWRWEWYGTVEVQVPDDWGYGTTDSPPCLDTDKPRHPYVGRPGPVPDIACAGSDAPPGGRTDYLWFGTRATAGVEDLGGGWAQETRVVDGLALTMLSADAALRARVLDSARPATGRNGCPPGHAVATDPGLRPDPGQGGLAAMGRVESITLCRYALGEHELPTVGRGLSSSLRTGEDARAVVRAIQAAPEGEGPNEPENCSPEVARGDEVLLLLVRDNARGQELVVRYSGCDGHGIDDGHTRHRLTADVLRPLLSGPHQPAILNGAVADLVWP